MNSENEYVSAVLERVTGVQSVNPDTMVQLAILGIVLALVLPPATWRYAGMYSTLVHELGHVLAALTTGRYVTGLRLGWDHSGQVVSRGRGKASVIISGSFGYPAPLWCAAGLLWACTIERPAAALGVFAAFFVLALIFVRNWPAFFVCLLSAASALAVLIFAPVPAVVFAVLLTAVFLAVAGCKDLLKLIAAHTWRRSIRQNSDAFLIARATKTSTMLWLWVILALATGGVWVAARAALLIVV